MNKIVFLDLDGVLADFVSSALEALGKSIDLNQQLEYSIENWFGITQKEFWLTIDSYGEDFWRNLDVYPWARELVNMMPKHDTYILSSPSRNPVSSSGKVAWVQANFPKLKGKIILTSHKHLLSSPNRILIDDSEHKINPFIKSGGEGILFPQPWNYNFFQGITPEQKISFVKENLKL